MKRIFVFLVTVAFCGASAQTTGELFKYSQNNNGISTARTAAMAGAFTSLGADVASMSINPAGLAMYKSGEFSFSPQLRFAKTNNGYSGEEIKDLSKKFERNDVKTKFVVGSLGAVWVYDGFAFGVGYNRLADYNTRSTSIGVEQKFSITDMFAQKLNIDRINSDDLQDGYDAFYNYPPSMWGAILGYQSYAVDNISSDPDDKDKYQSMLADGAFVNPYLFRKTAGGLDEYAISAAYTYRDKLYFGATIGIQSFVHDKTDIYTELAQESNTETLSDVDHARILKTRGVGSNIKLGMIYRPANFFRIGVSYHSPTWMSINEEYREDMTTMYFFDNRQFTADTPLYKSSYETKTPAKLLLGTSVTFGGNTIISFDFKRTWFNKMSYKTTFKEYGYRYEYVSDYIDNGDNLYASMAGNRRGEVDLNSIISEYYVPVNTYSVGIEYNVAPKVFLRGGYMYQESPYKNVGLEEYNDGAMVNTISHLNDYGKINQFSAGFGYRTSRFSVDLTYLNSVTKELPAKYYSYTDGDNVYASDGKFHPKQISNNIILTMGVRF